MIKNVIFDMGNVMNEYDPEEQIRPYAATPEQAKLVRQELFEKEEWRLLDAGLISEEELLCRVKQRIPAQDYPVLCEVFCHWHEYMVPKPETTELARELRDGGYRLFLLSNASLRLWKYWPEHPAAALFEGVVLSAEERVTKPDLEIYRRLTARFGLSAGECAFVDDMQENVNAARQCGLHGFCYRQDITALRGWLRELGVDVKE